MSWVLHRSQWCSPSAAVDGARHYEGWGKLGKHPVVVAALVQIELAEQAIQSVADQLENEYHDEPEEVGGE